MGEELSFYGKRFIYTNYFTRKKKEENPGSVEFQVFNFTNKIRRLTSHLELHRKDFLSQRDLRKILKKNGNDYCLICQRKLEYVIKN